MRINSERWRNEGFCGITERGGFLIFVQLYRGHVEKHFVVRFWYNEVEMHKFFSHQLTNYNKISKFIMSFLAVLIEFL